MMYYVSAIFIFVAAILLFFGIKDVNFEQKEASFGEMKKAEEKQSLRILLG